VAGSVVLGGSRPSSRPSTVELEPFVGLMTKRPTGIKITARAMMTARIIKIMSLFRGLRSFGSGGVGCCSFLASGHATVGFSEISEVRTGSIGSTNGLPYELPKESTAESGRTMGETGGFIGTVASGIEIGSRVGDLGGGCDATD
jgi:hypothetical protein